MKLGISETNDNAVVLNMIEKFGSITEILINSTEEELASIKGFGPKKVSQIIAFR